MLSLLLMAPLVLPPSPPNNTAVDGFFDEWLERDAIHVGGRASDDLRAELQLAYDHETLFIAVQVVDDLFQPGTATAGDGLELTVARPGGPPTRLKVVLGDLEGRQPHLEKDGKRLAAATLKGTTRIDGWAVELALPLSTLPELRQGPVALGVSIRDTDHDPVVPDGTLTNVPLDHNGLPAEPTLHLDPVAGLFELYQEEQGDQTSPLAQVTGQLWGDEFPEVVIVTGRAVVLTGYGLPGESAYMFFEPGWREGPAVSQLKLQDLDGRGGAEVLLVHEEWAIDGEVRSEVLEVYGLHEGHLKRTLAVTTAEDFVLAGGKARSAWSAAGGIITVQPATVEGLNPGSYRVVDTPGLVPYQPILLPWNASKPARYMPKGDTWSRR